MLECWCLIDNIWMYHQTSDQFLVLDILLALIITSNELLLSFFAITLSNHCFHFHHICFDFHNKFCLWPPFYYKTTKAQFSFFNKTIMSNCSFFMKWLLFFMSSKTTFKQFGSSFSHCAVSFDLNLNFRMVPMCMLDSVILVLFCFGENFKLRFNKLSSFCVNISFDMLTTMSGIICGTHTLAVVLS